MNLIESSVDDEILVVDYMEQRFSESTLRKLLKQMQMSPQDVIRWKDYARLELPMTDNEDELIQYMEKYPEIIQRPIVVVDGKSALCRPAEKVFELLRPQKET